MKLVRLVIAFAVMMTLDAPLLLAQVDQGRIAGTVRDQSNAFATATPVTVTNERTGETRAAVTNDKGYFLVSGLKPSTYTIHVERAGFSAIEYTAMPLAVGQELTLDNRRMAMIEDADIRDYRPTFVMDRDGIRRYAPTPLLLAIAAPAVEPAAPAEPATLAAKIAAAAVD